MNPNHSLAAIGTFATAAAVAAVASAMPSDVLAASFQPYTGQATTTLNVRNTPSTGQPRIGLLKQGDTFQVTGIAGKSEKGNWLKIVYKNKSAYVDGAYVVKAAVKSKPAPAQAVQKVSAYQGQTTDNLNIRFLPNLKGTILATLQKGTPVTVIGKTSDGWLQISYKNGSAYVSSTYVSAGGSIVAPPKTIYTAQTTSNLNVRTGTSTSDKILTTLKKGSNVNVVGTSSSWLKINYNNSVAYVSAKYVAKPGNSTPAPSPSEPSAPAKVVYTGTTTDDLNVRAAASTSSQIKATLKKGSSVEVIGTSGSWLKINYNNGVAYVSSSYVAKPGSTLATPKVQYTGTTTDDLNVRAAASTSSQIKTTLKKGSSVEVVSTSGSWLEIKYGNGTAYVSSDYVQKDGTSTSGGQQTAPAPIVTSTNTYGVITGSGVNFRKGPGTSYGKLTSFQKGAKVEWLTTTDNGWVKISYNGQDGYVSDAYITQETVTNEQAGDVAYSYTKYPMTFGQALALEQKVNSSSDLAYYLNPNNFQQGTPDYFQFLKLSSLSGVTASQVNSLLKGDGILAGHGADFVHAAQKYSVNEIYLVAHALLETGNGNSSLANGVSYKGYTVYNMFGIGAFDLDPLNGGAALALQGKWYTPADAIFGGAKWIAANYIYNQNYQQDTLYKMRWNPDALVGGSAAHQYATDTGWAVKQTSNMEKLYVQAKLKNLLYDVPQYN
ncbi:hypothetical protein E4665_10505 [Sporolactobacillus shoreae]|uniref:SH3b domain-containing protein n=1 Tax=Sporolactobacillus shoreae TaxID=1465501 RepID=A0A4Z0GLG1_9BACL|nr:SH3 domain-containing protein [Sporolactobacillus shoreae]TGA97820.1 hypothetical protein E4665_10505 [Sporolactobacillus shoreae]